MSDHKPIDARYCIICSMLIAVGGTESKSCQYFMRYSYDVGRFWHGCRPSIRLSVVCNGCIVAKRCEIRPTLRLIINRKSHIVF